jgi:HD superfamily phosphohydrolase
MASGSPRSSDQRIMTVYPPVVHASPPRHTQQSTPVSRWRVAAAARFRQIECRVGQAHNGMTKKIRDTIHGYIYLTKVEEAVSQHPLVLRLHYVHQTSFTYLTYPNAHSTRYPHSLGVMHVASEIFSAALKNSDSSIVESLAETVRSHDQAIRARSKTLPSGDLMKAMIDEVIKNDLTSEPVYAVWVPPQFKASVLDPGKAEPADAHSIIPFILLHQAIRLAALLHDIGHPPFSHVVEYSLLEAFPGKYEGHEPVGAKILEAIISDTNIRSRSAFQKFPIFSEMCLRLAQVILSKNKSSSFYGLKRSLIDGPMDADRLDYVQRDIRSAGIVPAYDIRRLVDAAFFRKCGPGGAHYEIGYQPNCLSAFENFFMARYDLYRWVIYHHDVVRRNLSIQRGLAILLNPESRIRADIKRIGDEIGEAACGEADGYRRFVDSFLLDSLWRLLDLLEAGIDAINHTDEADLQFFLLVVLARRNDKLETILKRPDAYAALCRKTHGDGEAEVTDRESVKWVNDRLATAFANVVTTFGGNENRAKLAFARHVERQIQARVAACPELQGIRVYAYYLGTFQAAPDRANQKESVDAPLDDRRLFFSSPRTPHEPVWARSVSPTIAMLEEAWSFSPQLLLFYTPQESGRLALDGGAYALLWDAVAKGLTDVVGGAAA